MANVNPIAVTTARGLRGLEALVADVDKLVSLPDIYYRLEEAIVDPASTTDRIADLLRRDPDLCARMLRLANSPFYGFTTSHETIERALSVIGLRQIRELVLVTSVVRAFEGIPTDLVNMSTFWEHSVAVGIMARSLGERARIPGADSFYLPGLLHDIGRLVMYLRLPGLTHELLLEREATACCMFELERDLLGYSHTEIGARLLETWKLPQSIWEPVATHHNPAGSGEFAVAACAIHIADAWVNTNRAGSTGSCYLLEMDQDALHSIGIDTAELHQIGLEAAGQTLEVVRQFMTH